MACGLPVLASRTGGALDLLREGENGSFFESEDAYDCAGRLGRLLAAPASWETLGQNARSSVVTYASLPVIVRKLQAVYQNLSD
jgi:glycosyltransferase involved in cell wall biosynthesis